MSLREFALQLRIAALKQVVATYVVIVTSPFKVQCEFTLALTL